MIRAHRRLKNGLPGRADYALLTFGWQPEIAVEEGLRRTVDFLRARLQA